VIVSGDAATVGANPKCAVARDEQGEDAVLVERGRVLAIEKHELRAVEADEASAGSDPKIAVWSLREGLYCFFRQAVLRVPNAERIAGEPWWRSYGERLRGEQQNGKGGSDASHVASTSWTCSILYEPDFRWMCGAVDGVNIQETHRRVYVSEHPNCRG
jgi:hypothetical protein